MKGCRKGAILTVNELVWTGGAAIAAGEYLETIITAETPPLSSRTEKDGRLLKARRSSLAGYNSLARKVAAILKKHHSRTLKPGPVE